MVSNALIGLPGSGKTTYLAALWNALTHPLHGGSLTLNHLSGDHSYLMTIASDWLACREVARTAQGADRRAVMEVRDQSGKQTTLVIPDTSGEVFRLQWRDRQWTKQFADMISGLHGIMLFVHPDQVREPVRIDEANYVLGNGGPSPLPQGGEEKQWNPDDAATQVQLVDILQMLVAHVGVPLRVVAVASAWDVLPADVGMPQKWFERRLPLLHQYLTSNDPSIETTFFGVSAQGGKLPEEAARLLAIQDPLMKVQVHGEGVLDKHDIARPLRWLLEAPG